MNSFFSFMFVIVLWFLLTVFALGNLVSMEVSINQSVRKAIDKQPTVIVTPSPS